MAELMVTFECEDVRDLAAILGYSDRDAERKVYRWAAGTNRPSYDALMQIVKKVGEATGRTPALHQEEAVAEATSGGPLRALAESVGAMVRTNQGLHERIEDVETRLRALDEAPRRARSGNKRRATSRK